MKVTDNTPKKSAVMGKTQKPLVAFFEILLEWSIKEAKANKTASDISAKEGTK